MITVASASAPTALSSGCHGAPPMRSWLAAGGQRRAVRLTAWVLP